MLYNVTFTRRIGAHQCAPGSQNWITETPDEAVSKTRNYFRNLYREEIEILSCAPTISTAVGITDCTLTIKEGHRQFRITFLNRKKAMAAAEEASRRDFDGALQYLAGLNMEGGPL